MQTRMVQLLGRQVITPGRIPLGAPQLKIFPFEIEQLPAKMLVGPETDPWQVVPVVETKKTASLHDDRINAAGDATSGGFPVAHPSSASRSERLGPHEIGPPSGFVPPSGAPASGGPASEARVWLAGNPREASVCE
jgi:hypothetical protein